ncbi:MAG: hypothetical protein EPN93_06125 [Spirochaetes bacterium]|nr:MAG: hypothetical protein EPN93_06125 [Spirochaetota bacterium]
MRPGREDIIKFLEEHKAFMLKEYRVTRIGVFGSIARNEYSDQSDIDLIVEFETDTPDLFELKSRLRYYIHENLSREVDICREKYLKPFARDAILRETIYV